MSNRNSKESSFIQALSRSGIILSALFSAGILAEKLTWASDQPPVTTENIGVLLLSGNEQNIIPNLLHKLTGVTDLSNHNFALAFEYNGNAWVFTYLHNQFFNWTSGFGQTLNIDQKIKDTSALFIDLVNEPLSNPEYSYGIHYSKQTLTLDDQITLAEIESQPLDRVTLSKKSGDRVILYYEFEWYPHTNSNEVRVEAEAPVKTSSSIESITFSVSSTTDTVPLTYARFEDVPTTVNRTKIERLSTMWLEVLGKYQGKQHLDAIQQFLEAATKYLEQP